MEASGPGGLMTTIQNAIDDLRKAGENATGDAGAQIDSAMERLRDASSSVTSQAQERAGGVRDTVEGWREWIQDAASDALDEVQKEIDKRRQQLRG